MNFSIKKTASSIVKSIPSERDIKVKASWLDTVLTRTLIPSLGLHVTLITSVLLYEYDKEIFALFLPVFCVALFSVLLRIAVSGFSSNAISASRQSNAVFGFLVLSIIAAATNWGVVITESDTAISFGLAIIGAYCIVVLLYVIDRVQPLSLVVIGVYSTVFFHFFQYPPFWMLALLSGFCFSLGSIIIIRKKQYAYLIGFLIGGLVTIALGLSYGGISQQAGTLVVFSTVLILALIIYEIATKQSGYSDFVRFLAQGTGVCVILATVTISINSDSVAMSIFITSALFSAYTAFVAYRSGKSGLASRLVWIVILVATGMYFRVDTPVTVVTILMASVLVILGISHLLASGFARVFAVFNVLVLLGFSLFQFNKQAYSEFRKINVKDNAPTTIDPSFSFGNLGESFAIFLLTVAIAIIVASIALPRRGFPWWHGLIKERNAVVIRATYRSVAKKLKDAPFIGWIYSLFVAGLTSFRFIKGEKSALTIYDFLSAVAHIVGALGTNHALNVILFYELALIPIDNAWAKVFAYTGSWIIWGLILTIRGYLQSSLMFRLLGFIFFCIPVLTEAITRNLINSDIGHTAGLLVLVLLFAAPVYLVSLLPKRHTAPEQG